MTTDRTGALVLAADMSGFGDFAPIAIMQEPSIALAASVSELQSGPFDEGRWPVLIHLIATRIAGRCVIRSREGEAAAKASFSLRFVMEWRITIPGAGAVQALFVVKRLQTVDGGGEMFDLSLQLAGKPGFYTFRSEELAAC